MTVNDIPVVTFTLPDDQMCIDEAAVVLSGGLPAGAGGVYTGLGVAAGSFTPATAGAGPHTLTYTYTDGNGCDDVKTDVMTVNALPVITFSLADDQMCINEDAQEIVTYTPVGGILSGGGVVGTKYDPSATVVGVHPIKYKVIDVNGCADSLIDNMTVNAQPIVTFSLADKRMCIDEAPQVITVASPLGGFFTGAGTSGVKGINYDPATTTAGVHAIKYFYTDGNGCTNQAQDDMTVDPLPIVVLADDTICDKGSTTFDVGPGFKTYQWSQLGTGQSQSTIATQAGQYFITVSNQFDCVISDSAILVVNPIPTPELGADTAMCDGETIELNPGTSKSLIYQWTPAGNQATLSVVATGEYKVKVIDNIGCFAVDSIFVQKHDLPVVTIGNDTTMCDNGYDHLTLRLQYSGVKELWWSTNDKNVDSIVVGETGAYWVQVSDSNSCFVKKTIAVSRLCADYRFTFPNVMTPNGDGKNDEFHPYSIDDNNFQQVMANMEKINFVVFDRWGVKVFQSEKVLPRWDGKFNGGDLPAGTYYWIVRYSNSAGNSYEDTGYLTLIR